MPTRVCLFLTQNSFTRTPTYCTDLLAVTQLQLSEEIKMDWLMKSKSPKFPSDTTGSRYFFKNVQSHSLFSLFPSLLLFTICCFILRFSLPGGPPKLQASSFCNYQSEQENSSRAESQWLPLCCVPTPDPIICSSGQNSLIGPACGTVHS